MRNRIYLNQLILWSIYLKSQLLLLFIDLNLNIVNFIFSSYLLCYPLMWMGLSFYLWVYLLLFIYDLPIAFRLRLYLLLSIMTLFIKFKCEQNTFLFYLYFFYDFIVIYIPFIHLVKKVYFYKIQISSIK